MKKPRSISELKSDWIRLDDLDRAWAVRAIHNSGISIRQIAAELHKPDSSLRRLLLMLDAPIEDKLLFRQGKITGNELVRRSRAAGLRYAARHREEIELERARQTLKASDHICKWLLQTQMNGPNSEMIVDEARHAFHAMAEAGLRPAGVAPPDTTVTKIIEKTRPPELKDDSIDIAGWFAQWLCRWTFFAFPDQDMRDDALDLALQRQWGG